MSIPVELSAVADAAAKYRFAYLLTVGDDGVSHAVAVTPTVGHGEVTVGEVGRRTRANLVARPGIALLWPPDSVDGYSLIVDGDASTRGDAVVITPSRAVLHRPAPRPGPAPAGSSCDSDCMELPLVTAADPG